MDDAGLPTYEPMLASYHAAFRAELKTMLDTLPIGEGDRVLEVACGDGVYLPWVAEKAGPSGSVVGLDVLPEYLLVCRQQLADSEASCQASLVAAALERLPFADGAFDAAWCAQSLFSLPEPVEAVRRIARVVRSGGWLALLEDDTLHRVLLPWPIDVELAIRSAEWQAFREKSEHSEKFYVGRRLVGVFRSAGLIEIEVRSFASSRVAPLADSTRTYLGEYLHDLAERVAGRLDAGIRRTFERLTDPDSPDALVSRDDFHVTIIDHLILGRVPAA